MRKWIIALALVASVSVTSASSGCGAKGVISSNPTVDQVSSVQQLAVRVADEVKRAVSAARIIRNAAQAMTAPAGPIPAATMDRIDRGAITYGGVLKTALTELEAVTSEPGLKTTARRIWDSTKQFLDLIPATGTLAFLIDMLKATFTLTLEQGGV